MIGKVRLFTKTSSCRKCGSEHLTRYDRDQHQKDCTGKGINVYYLPNIDGRHSAVVVAETAPAACKRFGVSMRTFSGYGGHLIKPASEVGDSGGARSRCAAATAARSEPGTVFYKRILGTEWSSRRQS